ncbi:Clp protease N-terminal domain-containing protein [Actinokineospora inagensis]|uniref:Clp protease N-terminal domain-containing protein n=1 Tax=Actinokineospora inagensis TaxID=103730 RepID=UPI0003FC38D2|nr:Clp protease N-terminal domain-containing protein [Actinokineospora inagensis]
MFERFTATARQVVDLAGEEARLRNHNCVDTEHILLGLAHERGITARALSSRGVTREAVREHVERTVGRGPREVSSSRPTYSHAVKWVFELSLREALLLGHNYIGPEHLLLGLTRQDEGIAAEILRGLDVNPADLRETVHQALSGRPGLPAGGRDLVAAARAGNLPPVVGRVAEIDRVLQVLSYRTKNNPVLIGATGVGKRAVVNGVAERIASGRTRFTRDLIDLPGDRVEHADAPAGVVLVLDDLATAVSLAATRQVLTMTTPEIFADVERVNPALTRLCQPVRVEPSTRAEAEEVLLSLREKIQTHYRVSITDGAIRFVAQVADERITRQALPGSAIDLLDEVCSRRQPANRGGLGVIEDTAVVSVVAELAAEGEFAQPRPATTASVPLFTGDIWSVG